MRITSPIPFPGRVAADAGKATVTTDPLGEFGLETEHRKAPATSKERSNVFTAVSVELRQRWLVVVLATVAVAQIPFVVLWALQATADVGASTGNVVIETEPAGIEVRLDGRVAGNSPLQLPLAPGRRTVELRHGGVVRAVPVSVIGGETVRHRFEFIPSTVETPAVKTGALQVTTDPSRLTVWVDGSVKGTSPLSIRDLTAGEHTLAVRFESGTIERRVQINPGSTASIQISMPTPRGALSGWVDVDVPVSLQIAENGRLLGTTDVDRLMLPVGEHVLDIGSDELGFRVQRTINVTAGATTMLQLDLPRAALSINARPWAEAWIDGERVGETPIGNLSRPIGRHEVVLRHPELGERRQSVLVTLNQHARVSVDFREKP